MNPRPIPFGIFPVAPGPLLLERTILPLKSVHYRFAVRGGVAEVELTQIYRQENVAALDCEYLFPLPADAAVFHCQATIDGRVISARIEERNVARNLAQTMKAQGFRTLLVESERDNLFTLGLGNLQPRDVVEVRLSYLQPLRRNAGANTLDLPVCPGIRYVPGNPMGGFNLGKGTVDDTDQVPDASRITPPRIAADHPDAAFVTLEGSIDADLVDGAISSPSHQLAQNRHDDTVAIALVQGGQVPDRDLALRWNEPVRTVTTQRGWSSRSRGIDYALVEVRAPAEAESTGAVAQDLYFLIDRSGSMQGLKWQRAVEALHACVNAMSPDDRAMVTFFETAFKDLHFGPMAAALLRGDQRFREILARGTGGGTELAPALGHVLELVRRCSAGRPAAIVIITDAQVANDARVAAALREHPRLPVHCFGIDTVLNDALLLDLVRQQGGTFHAFQPTEDIPAAVAAVARTLQQPVLVNLSLSDGWELATRAIPNLYAGQVAFVSVRWRGAEDPSELRIFGRDRWNESVILRAKLEPVDGAFPYLAWSKAKLVTLLADGHELAAVALSKDANILCRLTAFVAWDEAEQTARAYHSLVQPPMEPMTFGVRKEMAGRIAGRCGLVGDQVKYSVHPNVARRSQLPRISFQSPGWSLDNVSTAVEFAQVLGDILQWIQTAVLGMKLRVEAAKMLGRVRLLLPQLSDAEFSLATIPANTHSWVAAEAEVARLRKELRREIGEFLALYYYPTTGNPVSQPTQTAG
jgi:Ca-activated chloride channel family protein